MNILINVLGNVICYRNCQYVTVCVWYTCKQRNEMVHFFCATLYIWKKYNVHNWSKSNINI